MKWPLKRLNDLGYVSRGRSKNRPRDAAHLYGGDYPFIQTGDVKHSNLYITQYTQTYSEAGLAQSRLWPIGTLCITIAANIADTSILSFEACFPDSIIGFIPDPKEADARFIKYSFDALLQKQYQNFSKGAAQDNLSQEKLLSIDIPAPSVDLQTKIADVLASYDAMIENNRRRIALLEQAARHLYEEWFVRFRFPGYEHTKFINGLPVGWQLKRLDELCHDVREHADPSKLDVDTPYIGLEHLPRRSITLCDWGKAEDVTSSKFCFSVNDILFGKIRPYFHKVGFALIDGITSSDAIVIRPNEGHLFSYCLCLLSSDIFVAFASKTVKEGSKMPRADWKFLREQKFSFPTKDVLEDFNAKIAPLTAQLKILAFQTKKAMTARDLLLPRLMNGEVEV